ncbi:MAG: transaldolase [Actinomycetota bacterium]
MSSNLEAVSNAGVSIWLDDLSRDRLQTGSLSELIASSNVVGVTTNPSIFSAAIKGSTLYRDEILNLKASGKEVASIINTLTTEDVKAACDLFLNTFHSSKHVDGRVSIEVDPFLAHQTEASARQGKALWKTVDRPNLLIKVPATLEGLPAITELTAAGISVNVTLIFSVERYKKVIDAYFTGLEKRLAAGHSISGIHSVASFFVSRIDTEIDKRLDALGPNSPLRGKSAIANAHLAYEVFLNEISSPRWKALVEQGANQQRPLWASTGVKDKAYDGTRYVIELIAPHCVNTMPESTLNEVRSHGVVRGDTITSQIPAAHAHFKALAAAGIDFADVVEFLEKDGVKKFADSWRELLDNVDAVI